MPDALPPALGTIDPILPALRDLLGERLFTGQGSGSSRRAGGTSARR
ncbi:hypothetical protein ACFQX4_12150 [Roseomonas sp. GCM10028921]